MYILTQDKLVLTDITRVEIGTIPDGEQPFALIAYGSTANTDVVILGTYDTQDEAKDDMTSIIGALQRNETVYLM